MLHMAANLKARPYAELGERIVLARKTTGLSQENFAPRIGITRRHLIRLEKGEHQPSWKIAESIARETGADVSEFRVNGEAALMGEPFRGPRPGAPANRGADSDGGAGSKGGVAR